MELFTKAGKQVGTVTNPVASRAGFLDGEMDAKGMCSLPIMGHECQISGTLFGVRE